MVGLYGLQRNIHEAISETGEIKEQFHQLY